MTVQPCTVVVLALPFALISSMALIFTFTSRFAGKEIAYLLSFGFYWLFWCILTPRILLGRDALVSLLSGHTSLFTRRNWFVASLWFVVISVAIIMYGRKFLEASIVFILLAVPFATVNGFCEELLWRGLFVHQFPKNVWLGILYPAVGFALWHLCPQIVFPARNVVGFLISTLFLALAYGLIAFRTGSAKWTAISHSLSGVVALASPLAQITISLASSS